MKRIYAAHIREEDGEVQSIREHLQETAALARTFASVFNSGDYGHLLGLLHDIGKYSQAFQQRIYGESQQRTDHATAGAVESLSAYPFISSVLAYGLMGHHTGLPDGGVRKGGTDANLYGRLKKTLPDYSAYRQELTLPPPPAAPPLRPLERGGFSHSFYIRMLFSCLVDADFLDTEAFMRGGRRGSFVSLPALRDRLDARLQEFSPPDTDINRRRGEILSRCLEKADDKRGLYTLTVPTGGGKTISSLAFALHHAVKNEMSRVIYVIPYNAIIEQNAAVFADFVGTENVLEHHSNFIFDDEKEEMAQKRLAAENWDMPVVVTTTVQFFESLFSYRTSQCRKLHNIANSVIIFDEAQMLPLSYLLPCVRAIAELIHNYRCTAVLCSATQPVLDAYFPKEITAKPICEGSAGLYAAFSRTKFVYDGELHDEELAPRLSGEDQVLCIVNLRRHALKLFRLLDAEGTYHLSTLMYPQHRKEVLAEIRRRLPAGLPCRVVSTSLIEAGVDVDFPVVYRAEAGVDSLVQAAGRCNREGRPEKGLVHIFRPEKACRDGLPAAQKRPAAVGRAIVEEFADIGAPDAIAAYFTRLYQAAGEGLDVENIVRRFEDGYNQGQSYPFREIGEHFHLIDHKTKAVLIPAKPAARDLLVRLRKGERSRQLFRALQLYCVNIYEREYDALLGCGGIEEIEDADLAVLSNVSLYDKRTGLVIEADGVAVMF